MYNPFSSDGSTDGKTTLITSGETFSRLTGMNDYSLVLIQTTKDVTDEDVVSIQNVLSENLTLKDTRDQRTTSTYMAFLLFVYGFLVIITLVTVLNIMNSISMSVSARMKQYETMRAVGMVISKLLYDTLITAHFSYAIWTFPIRSLVIILFFVLIATIGAVCAPAKKIRKAVLCL